MTNVEAVRSQHQGQALMLYDGVCGFCHRSVRWIAKHDRNDRYRFAPQQSELAKSVLARHGIDREAMLDANNVYMVLDYREGVGSSSDGRPSSDFANERLLSRSDVPVNVLLGLGGVWHFFGRLLGAAPKALRDTAYTLFTRNRFRFSERYDVCPVPTSAERAKFLV